MRCSPPPSFRSGPGWPAPSPSFSAGRRDASNGHSDSATKDDIATAMARTMPNSVKRRPAFDGRKAMGRKTEISVADVAITAKNT